MTKVQQWKPGQGSVDPDQTCTHEEHVRNRMPSDHTFRAREKGDRFCDWCGRRRDVHLLSEAI